MYQRIYTCSHRIDNKDKEDLVVSVSYAVVDPDTMVVHSKHTSFANSTMVSSRRFEM
jgi:hypothetical protein